MTRPGDYSKTGASTPELVLLLESQLNSLQRHVKILTAELALTHEWLFRIMGAEIVNIESIHYKSIHGPNLEIEAIKNSLEVTDNLPSSDLNLLRQAANNLATSDRSMRQRELEDAVSVALEHQVEDSTSSGSASTSSGTPCRVELEPKFPKAKTVTAKPNTGLKEDSKKKSSTVASKQKTPGKAYRCHYCKKAFGWPSWRSRHELTHTGEKPFKCRFCQKDFTELGNKRAHERIHTGERPFKCQHCPASFCTSSAKGKHMRTHTGAKPYSCSYCDKLFRSSNAKARHLRTHTNEKPYVCQLCGQSFAVFAQLRTHELRRHE